MKHTLILLLLLLSGILQAQVVGNGIEKTKEISFDYIESVEIELNVPVLIHANSDVTKVVLQSESNIIDLIDVSNRKGQLTIGQKEWIAFTQACTIEIYTPSIEKLKNDSWADISILNLNEESFKLKASIGEIKLEGNVQLLDINIEDANVDASQLAIGQQSIKITDNGTIKIGDTVLSKAKLQEKDQEENIALAPKPIDTRFIPVDIKNNSFQRIHTYVKGPKPDGRYFSYGLPFSPMQKRAENWSIGTKLYRVGILGNKTLLLEITAADEGKTIEIFN